MSPLAELGLDLIGGEFEHLFFIFVHDLSLSGPGEQMACFHHYTNKRMYVKR